MFALCQKSCNDARQDITRSALRHAWVSSGINPDVAFKTRNNCAVTFEDHRTERLRGRKRTHSDAASLDFTGIRFQKSAHLTRMRSQDTQGLPAFNLVRLKILKPSGECIQTVSINHHLRLTDPGKVADKLLRFRIGGHTGSNYNNTFSVQQLFPVF